MLARIHTTGLARSTPEQARLGAPTFSLRHRLFRALWTCSWFVLALWTPPRFAPWRRALLRLFGASIHPTAIVRSSAIVWLPAHLTMGAHACLGPGARCYNVAPITLEADVIVSQRAHLCAAGHDVDDPGFPLVARPIVIGKGAWIAAEAFVGPGVIVGPGAVLGARGVAMRDLDAWTVYAGNPARPIRPRSRPDAAR